MMSTKIPCCFCDESRSCWSDTDSCVQYAEGLARIKNREPGVRIPVIEAIVESLHKGKRPICRGGINDCDGNCAVAIIARHGVELGRELGADEVEEIYSLAGLNAAAFTESEKRIAVLEQALREACEHLFRMYAIVSGQVKVFPNNWTLQAAECLKRIETVFASKETP